MLHRLSWASENVNMEKQTCGAQYVVLSIFHPIVIINIYFILLDKMDGNYS
jgi:hypothetical protein